MVCCWDGGCRELVLARLEVERVVRVHVADRVVHCLECLNGMCFVGVGM